MPLIWVSNYYADGRSRQLPGQAESSSRVHSPEYNRVTVSQSLHTSDTEPGAACPIPGSSLSNSDQ